MKIYGDELLQILSFVATRKIGINRNKEQPPNIQLTKKKFTMHLAFKAITLAFAAYLLSNGNNFCSHFFFRTT